MIELQNTNDMFYKLESSKPHTDVYYKIVIKEGMKDVRFKITLQKPSPIYCRYKDATLFETFHKLSLIKTIEIYLSKLDQDDNIYLGGEFEIERLSFFGDRTNGVSVVGFEYESGS